MKYRIMGTALTLLLLPLSLYPQQKDRSDNTKVRQSQPSSSKSVKALVLVDKRLHERIDKDLNAYVKAASEWRGFTILVLPQEGIDDWAPSKVREHVIELRKKYSDLEGILYVGNIKLPSFFMPRADTPSTRLWARYLEDLDMVTEQRIKPGTPLKGVQNGDPNAKWPCVVGKGIRTPPHDFDWVEQGHSFGPELWAAFLPVGFAAKSKNTYDGWAKQLKPFFKKVLNFYKNPSAYKRSVYLVSNDLNKAAQLESVWNAVGPQNIDYYAIDESGVAKRPGAKGNKYVRAALEKYKSLKDFLAYASKLPWMGEGWQKPEIFLQHMNSGLRRVVWWNVHSCETLSIMSSHQARSAIHEGKGGLIALLSGCSVGGFVQPNSPSSVDTGTAVDDNMLACLVYGKSAFVAAAGSPHNRVNDDMYGSIIDEIFKGGYLGQGHKKQLLEQDRHSETPMALRERQEILIGDPFVDASEK